VVGHALFLKMNAKQGRSGEEEKKKKKKKKKVRLSLFHFCTRSFVVFVKKCEKSEKSEHVLFLTRIHNEGKVEPPVMGEQATQDQGATSEWGSN